MLMQWDSSILLFFQETIRNSVLTPFVVGITTLGNAGIIWILMSVGMLFHKKTRKIGCMGLAALVLSALVNNMILKPLIARPRPYELISALTPLIAKPTDYSFPSGHTAASFAAACVFYRNLPKKAGVPLMILAVLIALSRIYLGVHYPSDVLGGMISGVALSYLAEWITNKVLKRRETKHDD